MITCMLSSAHPNQQIFNLKVLFPKDIHILRFSYNVHDKKKDRLLLVRIVVTTPLLLLVLPVNHVNDVDDANMRTTAVQQNELGWHQLAILFIMISVIIADDDETR
jgi:hypothetical protein